MVASFREIYINPYLIFERLNKDYYVVVNPLKKHTVRLLTTAQVKLLNLLKDNIDNDLINHIFTHDNFKVFYNLMECDGFVGNKPILPSIDSYKSNWLNLWVHLTDSCNLRCKYCYIQTKDSNSVMSEAIMQTLISKILQTVLEENTKVVNIRFSGGEAFLYYKKTINFIHELREKLSILNCKLYITFLTNLTILNDEILSFIKKENISISASIDGIGDYNDKNRIFANGSGTYKIIEQNISTLVSNGIYPNLMTVVTNQSMDGLPLMTLYAIKHNLNIRYSIVYHEDFDYEKALKIFKKCYSYFKMAIKNGYKFRDKHRLCDLKFSNFSDRACSSGRDNAAIYTNGQIYFCHQEVGIKKSIGSIFDKENILSIIRNGDLYKDTPINPECTVCNYRFICSSGCPISRENGKSKSCNFYQQIIPTIFNLIGYEKLLLLDK